MWCFLSFTTETLLIKLEKGCIFIFQLSVLETETGRGVFRRLLDWSRRNLELLRLKKKEEAEISLFKVSWLLVIIRKILPLISLVLKNKAQYISVMMTTKTKNQKGREWDERKCLTSNCLNTRVWIKVKQKQTLRVFKKKNKTQEKQWLSVIRSTLWEGWKPSLHFYPLSFFLASPCGSTLPRELRSFYHLTRIWAIFFPLSFSAPIFAMTDCIQ